MKTYKKFELVAESVEKYEGSPLISPDAVANFIKPHYGKQINTIEKFFAIYVDVSLKPIGVQLIGQGGLAATLVDTKIVFKGAVESCANGVIISHNHPTGQLKPSRADHDLTEKIRNGLATLEIELHDHLIVTEDGHFSLR